MPKTLITTVLFDDKNLLPLELLKKPILINDQKILNNI